MTLRLSSFTSTNAHTNTIMSSFTFITRIALLIQAVLLIVSIASPVHAVVVPVHHVLRRDNGPHHGDFKGGFNAGHSNGASSSATDDTSSATADPATSAAEVAATSTDTAATTTSTASSSGTTYTGGYATYFYQEGVAGMIGWHPPVRIEFLIVPFQALVVQFTQTQTLSLPSMRTCTPLTFAARQLWSQTLRAEQYVEIISSSSSFYSSIFEQTVTATVADECPGCSTSTSLDLSVAAFEALSDLSVGTFASKWKFNSNESNKILIEFSLSLPQSLGSSKTR